MKAGSGYDKRSMEERMRIKELEEVLAGVDAMPEEWQLKCVRVLALCVDEWEMEMITEDCQRELKRQREERRGRSATTEISRRGSCSPPSTAHT